MVSRYKVARRLGNWFLASKMFGNRAAAAAHFDHEVQIARKFPEAIVNMHECDSSNAEIRLIRSWTSTDGLVVDEA